MRRSSNGYIGSYILPLSIAIHVYALGHIAYCNWRYRRQDNQIHIFHLQPEVERGPGRQQPSNSNANLNTRVYNKLLFEVTTIILFAILLITVLMTAHIIGKLQKENDYHTFRIIYYFQDWFPGVLTNVIFPCYFYKCNREARSYVKSKCFSKVQ